MVLNYAYHLCVHFCTLFHGHRCQTSEAFYVLISWTTWRKWQGCIESFVIVAFNLPTNKVKDITSYDKGRFDIWLTQGHDGLTDRKRRIPQRHWVISSCSHSLVKPFTWLQYEMPKLLYEAGEVRTNVILIILTALQVFQSIYPILAETLS